VCSSSQAISIGTNICIDQQSILRSYNLVQNFDLEHFTGGTFSPRGDQIKWFDALKGLMAVIDFLGTTTYKLSD